MIEELVAASIVTVSVFAITATSVATFKSYDRQRTIAAMIELENKLIGSLNSQETQSTIRSKLFKGSVPSGTVININALSTNGDRVQNVVATVGSKNYFSRLDIFKNNGFKSCTPSKADADCVISTQVDFNCKQTSYKSSDVNDPKKTSFWNCNAAYRIFAPGFDTLGAKSLPDQAFNLPTTTSPGDYTIPIAFESTSRSLQENCDPSPDHPNNLFAVGYDINTGKLICSQRVDPANPGSDYCGANEYSTEVVFDSSRNLLKLNCKSFRGMTCPQNYVLQKLSVISLRNNGNAIGRCVFIGAESAPFKKNPAPAPTISDVFCPINYHISSASCAPAGVSEGDGTCYESCPPCDNKGNCSTCVVHRHNRGSATQPAIGGTSTSCSLINVGQDCSGAYWNAQGVAITGTCSLNSDITRFVPASPL